MDYYNQIKTKIIEDEAYAAVKDFSKERYHLKSCYEIGEILAKAGKHYGDGIIKKYSEQLTNEFGGGYSTRNLKYMRKFYNFQKGQPPAAFLPWSHWIEILSLKDTNAINYYINIATTKKLSRNKLRDRIKSKEYERLLEDTKGKLINQENPTIIDLIPEPVLI